MSEASRGLDTSAKQNKVGPDYFGYYTREVAELFSQDENFLPFSSQTSDLAERARGVVRHKDITNHNYNGKEGNGFIGSGSLFCDAVGAGLPDFKKERLRALLRQSVVAFTGEVDEMVDPVINMHRLQSHLKKSLLCYHGATCEGGAGQHPQKKLKLSSSSSSVTIPLHASPVSCSLSGEGPGNEYMDVAVPGEGICHGVKKRCSTCRTTEASKLRTGPEGPKSLCHACGIEFKQGKGCLPIKDEKRESFLGSNVGAEKENEEVNDDLQFLLKNDGSMVEETMKKYSDKLSKTLGHMEQKVEEILDIVMSNCRSMTRAEKIQLRKLIQKLPPRNLDRVVEIIRRRKLSEKDSCDEINVDLEDEDNATLWRLYYYVEAVENARKLSVQLDLSNALS